MGLRIEKDNDITIIKLFGDFVSGKTESLKEAIDNILKENNSKIILDFSDVTFIDSSGIGVIINFLKKVSKNNGKLKLANLNLTVENILKQMQLLSIFEVYENIDEAIESFY